MIRRVIVDLMLALFATLFAVAVATHDKRGKQPLSQNFIQITAEEPLVAGHPDALELVSPENVRIRPSIYSGFPRRQLPDLDVGPKVYLVFPAAAGQWTVRVKRDCRFQWTTRSGPESPQIVSTGTVLRKELDE